MHAGSRRKKSAKREIQMTIRHVPPIVDLALRRKARASGKSINDVAIEALAAGAGVELGAVEHHDLDPIFGTWVDDPNAERALAEQRTIDAELWK